jgi:hypothetical protein
LQLLQRRLLALLHARFAQDEGLLALVEQVQQATLDPYTAVQQILSEKRRLWES